MSDLLTALTVRELLIVLARTEEELRAPRDPARVGARSEIHSDDIPLDRRDETMTAQDRILRELRTRHRCASPSPSHTHRSPAR